MRAFGMVLILIGAMVIYLGWQGKTWPAFQALFGLSPSGNKPNNGFEGSSSWGSYTPDTGAYMPVPGL